MSVFNVKNCLLKRLYEDIDFYKNQLKEILFYLELRLEVVNKFKDCEDELYRYLHMGMILDDIKKNYIEYESVCNSVGEIVEVKKVYQVKAESLILDTQMFISELEDDEDSDDIYIRKIEMELEKYKNKNIFTELVTLEELISSVNYEEFWFYDGSKDFIDKLNKFNKLDELIKYNTLNDFCYDNIEKNIFVDKLIKIYSEYNSVEVIGDINSIENMRILSRWNTEILTPILKTDSELYFKIINTLNRLKQLNVDLLNIDFIKEQIDIINELQKFLIIK